MLLYNPFDDKTTVSANMSHLELIHVRNTYDCQKERWSNGDNQEFCPTRTFINRATFNYLSLGSLFQIIPQNQSIAVPQPNANIISLMRVVGAWKEATPTKERTRQNAKPCMVPENCRRALNPVNIGDRTVTTNAS